VITQHVHRVVSRILDANDLGTLRGDLRPPIPARTALRPSFGFGGEDGDSDGSGNESVPDIWDPDAAGRSAVQGPDRKEWNLLVVNDQKVVNAMATPGMCVCAFPPVLHARFELRLIRYNRRLHGDPSRCEG
jgi:metalloendopeptidase OMA1, mitochondrial